MTPFDICKTIQRNILRTASEVAVYESWSDEFAISEIRGLAARIKSGSWFKPIDPSSFTMDELVELGFGRWSSDNMLMLIPLWLVPYLVPSFEGGSISDDERRTIITAEMDTDNRMGMLAYGVFPL